MMELTHKRIHPLKSSNKPAPGWGGGLVMEVSLVEAVGQTP